MHLTPLILLIVMLFSSGIEGENECVHDLPRCFIVVLQLKGIFDKLNCPKLHNVKETSSTDVPRVTFFRRDPFPPLDFNFT